MWAQLVVMAIGIWLQVSAAVFEFAGPAAANLYIAGPVVASIGCIAIWEVMRPMRWVNLPIGVWLAVSPLFLNYPTVAAVNVIISGLVIAGLACVRGQLHHRFAGGWSSLWREQAV